MKRFAGFAAAVGVWVTLGVIGEHVIAIEKFPLIMVFGYFVSEFADVIGRWVQS